MKRPRSGRGQRSVLEAATSSSAGSTFLITTEARLSWQPGFAVWLRESFLEAQLRDCLPFPFSE